MEDYYYPNSWEASSYVAAGFPGGNTTPSPRTARRASRVDADAGELHDHHQHYLDACFRCGSNLGGNKDIFMYRGDTPFCSDECRQQQIEADEAREKRSRHPAATKREQEREERRQQSSSPRRIPLWAR
ncbi:hypothetical protein BS78_04G235400 [Paspalum vaginatum]|nr:hypothetical protein BS78_04G235400 [Paspalum vaginatum]